jgi:hypothetical protein
MTLLKFETAVCSYCKALTHPKMMESHVSNVHGDGDIREAFCGCMMSRDRTAPPVEPCVRARELLNELGTGAPRVVESYLFHLQGAYRFTFG